MSGEYLPEVWAGDEPPDGEDRAGDETDSVLGGVGGSVVRL